jgi:NAD(P)-dependent dehydrogenase (short-subunit alcohol dehydrogenase family)
MLLKDKVALVTGSTHNIGLGIARAFAREGAKVVVHSRHEADAKKIAEEINGDFFVADVAKPEQIAAMFEHVQNKHGRLDVLVNNVAHSTKGGILDISLEEWNRVLAINLTGYFLCIQHAGRMMKAQGGGAIINISAGSGEPRRRGLFDFQRRGEFTYPASRSRSGADDSRQRLDIRSGRHADRFERHGQSQAGV